MFKTFVISMVLSLSALSAYAACLPVTIIAPDGSMVVCQVCNDGKTIICN
jgi:hypothetical protein